MSSTVLYMSMSLDGFITGSNVSPDNGLGDGRRLFEPLGAAQRELERIRALEGEGDVTHLRYRVRR